MESAHENGPIYVDSHGNRHTDRQVAENVRTEVWSAGIWDGNTNRQFVETEDGTVLVLVAAHNLPDRQTTVDTVTAQRAR